MRAENSFIGVEGVGEVTERKLWDAGVTHWREFDGGVVGATLADRIGAFVDEATERLERGDARFFGQRFPDAEHWRLYENFRSEACFFDIETTGLDQHADRVTTVSAHRGDGTTTLVRGQDLVRERLQELLDAPLLVTFTAGASTCPSWRSLSVSTSTPPTSTCCTPVDGWTSPAV